MASNDNLSIDLFAASRETQPLVFEVGDAFFEGLDQSEILGGDLRVQLRIRETGDDFFVADIEENGCVRVVCDRCLDEVTYDIEIADRVKIYYGEGEPEGEDIEILPPNTNTHDFAWHVYELAVLALPIQRIHPEGDCNAEMLAQLDEHRASRVDEEDDTDNDPTWGDN
ncbi:MAG: DUF177 domain-containing protein [Bacteroidales bacterium]|nr:DUF177 domain-containing protein [Bacteroidales bacterium]